MFGEAEAESSHQQPPAFLIFTSPTMEDGDKPNYHALYSTVLLQWIDAHAYISNDFAFLCPI